VADKLELHGLNLLARRAKSAANQQFRTAFGDLSESGHQR
jgi:hypothetical protein